MGKRNWCQCQQSVYAKTTHLMEYVNLEYPTLNVGIESVDEGELKDVPLPGTPFNEICH
jgi:hypothetical protein